MTGNTTKCQLLLQLYVFHLPLPPSFFPYSGKWVVWVTFQLSDLCMSISPTRLSIKNLYGIFQGFLFKIFSVFMCKSKVNLKYGNLLTVFEGKTSSSCLHVFPNAEKCVPLIASKIPLLVEKL